jgi:hypothetical protein
VDRSICTATLIAAWPQLSTVGVLYSDSTLNTNAVGWYDTTELDFLGNVNVVVLLNGIL